MNPRRAHKDGAGIAIETQQSSRRRGRRHSIRKEAAGAVEVEVEDMVTLEGLQQIPHPPHLSLSHSLHQNQREDEAVEEAEEGIVALEGLAHLRHPPHLNLFYSLQQNQRIEAEEAEEAEEVEEVEGDAVEVMAGEVLKPFCSVWHPMVVNLVGN